MVDTLPVVPLLGCRSALLKAFLSLGQSFISCFDRFDTPLLVVVIFVTYDVLIDDCESKRDILCVGN